MTALAQAIQADAARLAYQTSLTLAKAAHTAGTKMQWRTAARLYDQAAAALPADPHGFVHADVHLYAVRAHVCRTMVPCAVPRRGLTDAVEYHRRQRDEVAS